MGEGNGEIDKRRKAESRKLNAEGCTRLIKLLMLYCYRCNIAGTTIHHSQ